MLFLAAAALVALGIALWVVGGGLALAAAAAGQLAEEVRP